METECHSVPNSLAPAISALPHMEALGPHLFKPFPVRRIKTAEVSWLNKRWFLEAGINILADEVRREVSTWLLRTFGVISTDERSVGGCRPESVHFLAADRYGGSRGAFHGGSGRCGAYSGFNAKGIGRTSLAAAGVEWEHNHGCLWMHEAVREAIFAEIANAELPYGAVPVVAIIDTGIDYQRDQTSAVERRAIVVRPNFVRPAHFERSIMFGSGGSETSEQQIDALRVRDAVELVAKHPSRAREGNICFTSVAEMFARFARQLGYGRAHRLWQGQFLSSNLSITGALADFGAFRAVQNWQQAVGMRGQYFGNERKPFDQFIESMVFYFRKYGGEAFDGRSLGSLKEESANALSAGFKEACLAALPITAELDPSSAGELAALFQRYFETQQTSRFQLGRHSRSVWRRPWLYDHIGTDSVLDSDTLDARVAKSICSIVLRYTRSIGMKDRTALGALRRWLRPRPRLYYEIAFAHSVAFCQRVARGSVDAASAIEQYIDRSVSRSRRLWPGAPQTLHIFAQTYASGSSALYGVDDLTGKMRVWLQGIALDQEITIFDQRIPLDSTTSVARRGSLQVGLVGDICEKDREGVIVRLDNAKIRVPYPFFWYGPDNFAWTH